MPNGDFHQHTFSGDTPTTFTTSHPIRDKTRAEIMNERAALAHKLSPFVSQRWIMTQIFDFTEEEAQQIEMQRRSEASKIATIGGELEPLPALTELKRLAMSVDHAEDDDIAYFRRNMMKALRVPDHLLGPNAAPPINVIVGPNDYLVLNVPVHDIPPSRIEAYLKRVKQETKKVFEDAPFKDRMVFVANRTEEAAWKFSSIRIETQADKDRETQIHAMHAYAKENSYWIDGTRLTNGDIEKAREILRRTQQKPKKRPPIIMG